MSVQEGTFEGVGGLKLYERTWLPEGEPRAVLAVAHGVGEHIGRYENLAAGLLQAGFVVAGYDHRGHGRSQGQRGHIMGWEDYRDDLTHFLERVAERFPQTPRFLFGHSMGSLIVLDYLQESGGEGLRGAILSGTALEPLDAAPPLLVFVARLLSRLAPRFSLKVDLPGDSLARDPQVAQAYMEDPLVFWERSTRWGAETLRIIDKIKAHPDQITLPVLFVHGEADPLLSAQGASAFAARVASTDKTVNIYPESRHEPHNDLDHERVIADIAEWMAARL